MAGWLDTDIRMYRHHINDLFISAAIPKSWIQEYQGTCVQALVCHKLAACL